MLISAMPIWSAADFTGAKFEQLESIAGAAFTLVQGLSDAKRSRLLSQPTQQLEPIHPLILRTTLESLTHSS